MKDEISPFLHISSFILPTLNLALQIGIPDEIPQEDVDKLHDRYMNVYGQ